MSRTLWIATAVNLVAVAAILAAPSVRHHVGCRFGIALAPIMYIMSSKLEDDPVAPHPLLASRGVFIDASSSHFMCR